AFPRCPATDPSGASRRTATLRGSGPGACRASGATGSRRRRARARRPKGVPGLWTRVRRLIWAWWPWGLATVWALVADAWHWSAFFGVMAFVTYLSTPRERPPTYGLDHVIPTEDPAFLDS